VFGPGRGGTSQPAVDVKSLHAKIGELTLEPSKLDSCPTGDRPGGCSGRGFAFGCPR
jgi:hypothetical protein